MSICQYPHTSTATTRSHSSERLLFYPKSSSDGLSPLGCQPDHQPSGIISHIMGSQRYFIHHRSDSLFRTLYILATMEQSEEIQTPQPTQKGHQNSSRQLTITSITNNLNVTNGCRSTGDAPTYLNLTPPRFCSGFTPTNIE